MATRRPCFFCLGRGMSTTYGQGKCRAGWRTSQAPLTSPLRRAAAQPHSRTVCGRGIARPTTGRRPAPLSSPPMPIDFARLFGDLFELERVVDDSGERVLFLVRDRVLKRQVGLRVHLRPDTPERAWFLREAEVLAQLDHPSIRHVYSAGLRESIAYRVGNWIEGESLADAVRRGPRPIRMVLSLARDLMYAADHAHVRGVVMRRVLPTTLMLDISGRAVATDLRFANRVLDVVPPAARR